jgi:8-oxo-dGTP pyrophosphatase MutT (NUDIX family)
MIVSVGFVIIWENKILLAHPKKQDSNTWGIAKGKLEKNETLIQCAIRETYEEIGLLINENIVNVAEWNTIIYRNLKNKAYKKLQYHIININDLSEIGMINDVIEYEKLSIKEIDEARFMSKSEAETKIFWRQKEMLDLLK